MTCRDVEALIIRYAIGAPVPSEAAEHIAGCERCRSLARALSQAEPSASPSAEQVKRIEDIILADLKPVRRVAPSGLRFFILMLIAVAIAIDGSAVLGTAGWHAQALLQKLVVFAALAACAGLLAFSLGRQIVPGSKVLLGPYWLLAGVYGTMAAVFVSMFQPHPEATFVATGLVCLRVGIECAMAAAAFVWLMMRRGAILSPLFTGATAGAFAGVAGLTVLEIFCPNLNRHHILVWHLGAALASVAGGVAIGILAEHFGGRRQRTR